MFYQISYGYIIKHFARFVKHKFRNSFKDYQKMQEFFARDAS